MNISTIFLISTMALISTSAAGEEQIVDTSSQLRRRMGDVACLTLADCKAQASSMGVEPQYFYNNNFHTKGCFTKTNPTGVKKAFWSQGTVEQMSTTDLKGVQERIMCEGSTTPTPPTNKPTSAACKSIVEIAAGNDMFSTLVTATTAAGLVDTLSNNAGDLTVFAPTNEAFAKLPEATVNDLLKPENVDQLTSILTYHVVEGKVLSLDLTNCQVVTTLNGETVTVTTGVAGTETGIRIKTGIRINDSNIVSPFDVNACNGVVHAIDTVLMPPVPAPSPTPPTPTPPTPSTPSFNCPATSFIGCTARDPQDFEDECSTVGEPCENGNEGEFCCRDGCPRNYCTAKPASTVKQFSASNTNGSFTYSLIGAATAVSFVMLSSIIF